MKFSILPIFICVLACFSASGFAAYDKNYVGETLDYDAAYEDTFVHLAREHNLGYVEMRAANPGIDPWLPGAGTDLILPTRHLLPDAPREGIVINLPEMRLYAFVNGDSPPESYPIGVGREGLETPEGQTTIVRKVDGPVWRPTERMKKEKPELPDIVPPGPENPMGTHALYLGWPLYAIHGTNKPYGIGRRVSSGCIRLYPEDIVKLHSAIEIGTMVTVVDQPVKVGWIEDRLYLEAHPTIAQANVMEETGIIGTASLRDEDMKLIIRAAGEHEERLRWPAIRTALKERRGYPVEIARRPSSSDGSDGEESYAAARTAGGTGDGMNEETVAATEPQAGAVPVPERKPDFGPEQEAGREAIEHIYAAGDREPRTATYAPTGRKMTLNP